MRLGHLYVIDIRSFVASFDTLDLMIKVPIGEYFASEMENKRRQEQNESIKYNNRTLRFANGGLAIETEDEIKEIK